MPPFAKRASHAVAILSADGKGALPSVCEFTKVDGEHGIVYGWAIVSTVGGEPYFDLHGDHIPMDACIKAASRFMAKSRISDDQHDEMPHGFVPFCMPVYKGITVPLLGLSDVHQEGLIIGAKVSAETMSKINAGERRGFSIGGSLFEAAYASKRAPAPPAGFAAGGSFVVPYKGRELARMDATYLKRGVSKGDADAVRRIFVDFDIEFISTVDWPAQEGALFSVIKSKGKNPIIWIAKDAYLTDDVDGHQHVVSFDSRMREDGSTGWTSYAVSGGEENGHSHDFIVDTTTGEVTIAATNGHTHTVAAKAPIRTQPELSPGVEVMTPVEMRRVSEEVLSSVMKSNADALRAFAGQKTVVPLASTIKAKEHDMDPEELKKLNEQLKKQNASLVVLAEMSDVEKSHRATLTARDVEAFDTMTRAQRLAEVQKAQDADPIVYTSDDGTVIRKSHGQLAERQARKIDELTNANVVAIAKAETAEYEKRATTVLKHFPKTLAVKAMILRAIDKATVTITKGADGKSVETVDAETRKAALELLAAGDRALSKSFRRSGKNTDADPSEASENPERELDRLAKEYAKEHKISFHKAYDAVLKTEEGEALYAEAQEQPMRALPEGELDEFDDDDGDYEVTEDETTTG